MMEPQRSLTGQDRHPGTVGHDVDGDLGGEHEGGVRGVEAVDVLEDRVPAEAPEPVELLLEVPQPVEQGAQAGLVDHQRSPRAIASSSRRSWRRACSSKSR